MNTILVGYPGSQVIRKTSEYLTKKYLPFPVTYLNYSGGIEGWGTFLADYLTTLTDDEIIFALDDYLLSGPLDMHGYWKARNKLQGDVVCVKLCKSSAEEHEEYPVTTQYTIWNRMFLVSLLRKSKSPWHFEMTGSRIFRELGKKSEIETCLPYPTASALSSRWEGIRVEGNNPEDINYLKTNGYI